MAAPPAPDPRAERLARLRDAVAHASHLLPAQAPLDVFVHHNTLHAFQHLPFHAALSAAERRLGVRCYLDEESYREAWRRGRIRPEDLDRALAGAPFAHGTSPPGFPAHHALARLLLVHDLRATTPARLRWTLDEHEGATRFAPEVSPAARTRVLVDTIGWLRASVAGADDPVARFAEHVLGTPPPPDADEQLRAILGGAPTRARVERALWQPHEAAAVSALWAACRARTRRLVPPAAPAATARHHRDALRALTDEDPCDLVHPVLIPLCGAFLDRGQAHWPMPDRARGFFGAWSALVTTGRAVRPAWLASLGQQLRAWRARGATAEDVALDALAALGVGDDDLADFVEATLLLLPGWAGMFHRTGRGLADFLAVRLVLDALAVADVCARAALPPALGALRALAADRATSPPAGDHVHAWPLFLLAQHAGVSAPRLRALAAADVAGLCAWIRGADAHARVERWHEAYELHYRDELLHALVAHRAEPLPAPAPRAQVITCIDDRCESLRRHLEEVSEDCATYGAPGFFNLAIAYQGVDDPTTFPLCPVVVVPQHRVAEEPVDDHADLARTRIIRRRRWGRAQSAFARASRSLVLGPLLTALAGFVAAVPLLLQVFAPRLADALRRRAARELLPTPQTRLTAAREARERADAAALVDGFTVDEKAERVGALLENLGLTAGFAPLVLVLGHEAASVNNPHFAAYHCGACGGRSGGPNARLLARMANRPEVRARLRARGIDVPDATVFVGGAHDTCADAVRLFDLDALPPSHAGALDALRATLDEALRRNAHERCRRFASAPAGLTPAAALVHVRERAVDLAQPRPELGHATNAACVVGRRALTRGLFLDRRAFLVSYDPAADRGGAALERVLLAAAPVGAGISLEYFFSTTDNARLGAGTKLPHNVTGLVGVMDGAASDLRTGLPRQMIEVHEPVRLHLVVEAATATVEAVLARSEALAALVKQEWVRVATIDPATGKAHVWDARHGFRPWHGEHRHLPTAHRSSDWYAGRDGFVPPARILPDALLPAWKESPDAP